MLVFSRKEGEKVCIGDDVIITVVEIDRGRVRLGIVAPKGVLILREELADGGPQDEEGAPAGSSPPPG